MDFDEEDRIRETLENLRSNNFIPGSFAHTENDFAF